MNRTPVAGTLRVPSSQQAKRGIESAVLAMVQAWNPLHSDRASEEILRQIVLCLRTWRPSVVLAPSPDERVSGSASSSRRTT